MHDVIHRVEYLFCARVRYIRTTNNVSDDVYTGFQNIQIYQTHQRYWPVYRSPYQLYNEIIKAIVSLNNPFFNAVNLGAAE